MEPPSSRTRLVVAESNLRGFRGLTVDAFGCLLRGGPAQLPNALRKIVAEHNGDRNARSPEDLWRDTFRKYIRANPFLSFREVHRKTIQDFFEALGIANDVDGCIDAVFHEYRSSSAYPEVLAVLRDVEQEVPVAVVSNMDTTALLEALQRNGLSFTFIITSDEEQRYKPDPSGERDGPQSGAGARLHPEFLERIVARLALGRSLEVTMRPRESEGHLGRRAADAGCGGPIDFGARLQQRRASRSSGSRFPGGAEAAGTDE